VQAIVEEFDLTDEQQKWLAINAERAQALPIVSEKQAPLATAEERRSELGY
jgi:ferredoxin